jgi:hypothetical protein
MSIKQRIENIKEYFKEMQIVTIDGEQVIYVIVNFPYGWVIDELLETKFQVTVQEGEYPNEFYFATSIDNGEEKVFDAIEYNIEKMKDAIERAQLLKTKIAELKDIFQNEDISLHELRTLTFKWNRINVISEEDFNDEILVPHGELKTEKDLDTTLENSTSDETTPFHASIENEGYDKKYNKKNKK